MAHINHNPALADAASRRGPLRQGSRKAPAQHRFGQNLENLCNSFSNLFQLSNWVEDSEREGLLDEMAPLGGSGLDFEAAAMARRKALDTRSGPLALLKNLRVFGIACFACLGGLLYGYNQGVFSGVLTMTSFKERKSLPLSVFATPHC